MLSHAIASCHATYNLIAKVVLLATVVNVITNIDQVMVLMKLKAQPWSYPSPGQPKTPETFTSSLFQHLHPLLHWSYTPKSRLQDAYLGNAQII